MLPILQYYIKKMVEYHHPYTREFQCLFCKILPLECGEDMENQGRQLVLVPSPFQGHINPMLQLGTILHSRGFSITIAQTQFNTLNPSDHPDFSFLDISNTAISYSHKDPANFIGFFLSLNANCGTPLQELLEQMIHEKDYELDQQPPCIIYDEFMYFSEAVARHLKLPSIILCTASASNLLMFHEFPRLQEEGYLPLQDSMLTDLVPRLHPLRFKDLFVYNFENPNALVHLFATARKVRSSSAIIFNTVECLEQSSLTRLRQQHCHVQIFAIGPMHNIVPIRVSSSLLEEETRCLAWLDKQTPNSVIYISMGTIASMDANELKEMAWGLVSSKQPFLWVIRTDPSQGRECTEILPHGFEESIGDEGCIVKWAPQKEVLAHPAIGGFWSHCGWNSTLESLSEGIPMICRPCFGDQRVNARYLNQVWGAGLEWEGNLDRGGVEKAVRILMADEKGSEIRRKAKDLKKKIEFCVKQGGSSSNALNGLIEFLISVSCV